VVNAAAARIAGITSRLQPEVNGERGQLRRTNLPAIQTISAADHNDACTAILTAA